MPAGKGRGIAIHDSYDSVVGMIAEVAVLNGEVKVERGGDRFATAVSWSTRVASRHSSRAA